MSWAAQLLNRYLRYVEKPHLRRVRDPDALRRDFLQKARLFFHAPWGTQQTVQPLGPGEAMFVQPRDTTGETVILYFHGGGYVFGAPETHAAMVAALAKRANATAILPRYPLAPEHPYPAAPDFAQACYEAVLQTTPARRIVLGGDSAGGGLALALLARILRSGLPKPAGLFAFSPLTDLSFTGDSIRDNAGTDVELPADRVHEIAEMYVQGADPQGPDVSPLFADFTDAPPIWVTVGDTEILRDDSRRLAHRLTEQAVDVTCVEERDLPHVWPIFHNTLPEARRTLHTVAGWINRHANSSTPTR